MMQIAIGFKLIQFYFSCLDFCGGGGGGAMQGGELFRGGGGVNRLFFPSGYQHRFCEGPHNCQTEGLPLHKPLVKKKMSECLEMRVTLLFES